MADNITFHVLLTLDLKNLPDDVEGQLKRKQFYDELKKRYCHKIDDVTTAWSKRFINRRCTYVIAVRKTINDVVESALKAKIDKWSAVAQVGNKKLIEFNFYNYQRILRGLMPVELSN